MRIAIAATYDVTDVNNWSGTALFVHDMIAKHFDVTPVKIDFKRPLSSWIKGLYYNRLLKKVYFVTFDKSVYRKSRKLIREKFNTKYDVIITFDYFLIPALAPYAKDIILYTDATFDNLLNYYKYRTNLCSANVKGGHALQEEAFSILKYAVFSSDWARENAINRYGARKEQLIDINYGSNLTQSLDESAVEQIIENRLNDDVIRLFFPVVYWERKGGDYVLKIIEKLNSSGHKAKLVVAGRMPVEANSEHVIYLGFLDKQNPEDEKKMVEEYKRSHFLIMPSKADCTPIVFPEANSFAMPVISTKTGGIESVINPQYDNGITYELDDTYVNRAVEYIVNSFESRERYRELCRNAFKAYKNHFEWKNAEKILVDMINSLKN